MSPRIKLQRGLVMGREGQSLTGSSSIVVFDVKCKKCGRGRPRGSGTR